jgi:hypothetical protein
MVSCSSVSPINGSLFTQTTAGVTGQGKMGTKKGEACMTAILGVAVGDVSVETAAKNGNIKTITHVDSRATNVLGFYANYCTVVYGN